MIKHSIIKLSDQREIWFVDSVESIMSRIYGKKEFISLESVIDKKIMYINVRHIIWVKSSINRTGTETHIG
jgi:hypothetical protein